MSRTIKMAKHSSKRYAARLFEYFYPVHYQLNMMIEDAIRGPLTRKEAALLFLLYAEGGSHASLPRKLVVERLNSWFDSTSSNVTKIIARLASAQVNLVQVTNEPGSGRDKRVSLSPNGRAFIRSMLEKGEDCTELTLGGLSDEQAQAGLEFFRAASAVTNTIVPLNKLALGRIKPKSKLKR